MPRVTNCIFCACDLYHPAGTGPLPKVFTRMGLNFNRLTFLPAPARLAQTLSVPLPFSHPIPLSLYYPCTARTNSENALYTRGVWRAASGRRETSYGRPCDSWENVSRTLTSGPWATVPQTLLLASILLTHSSQHSDQSGRSMSATKPNFDTLRFIAEMPFMDRLELSAISGKPQQRVYEDVSVLGRAGLVDTIPHSTPLLSPTRRLYVTLRGLRRLADDEGISLRELLDGYPVSSHWRSLLLERLDAVGVINRVASSVAWATGPLKLKWYRSEPLDAVLTLSDGRTLGILRQGVTSDRTGFSRRIWRLLEGRVPGGLLVIVPDAVTLRHSARLLQRAPGLVLMALEEHVAYPTTQHSDWRTPSGGSYLALGNALSFVRSKAHVPTEGPLARPRTPGGVVIPRTGLDVPDHLLPALLRPGEKRVMDILADWPWITTNDLGGLLGVSKMRVSQLLTRLVEGRIVSRVTSGRRSHMALTDWGLAVLARRDRTAVGRLRKQWSAEPSGFGAPLTWQNVSGRRSGQLARNMEHTEAVHWFISRVAAQARERGFQVVQIDPPHRASRHFWHRDKLRSIHPDAFGMLRKDGHNTPFFLEWERRAVRPSTMASRLAPYLRYYSSHRPTDDHGAQPLVMMVFDDPFVEARFLGVARSEMTRTRVDVPLWVSYRERLEQEGPLGKAWRHPNKLEPSFAFA